MKPAEDKGCYIGSGAGKSSSNACGFEFHKTNGSYRNQRQVLGARSKQTPSKWDDAQKWLAGFSSRSLDHGHNKEKPRDSNAEDRRLIAPTSQMGKDSSCSTDEEMYDLGTETAILDEGETKKIDYNESFWRINRPMEESLSAVRSVCLRDMGTEMTPVASQRPSRTTTPLRASTPVLRSPISSRSSTPGRVRQGGQGVDSYQASVNSSEGRNDNTTLSRPSRPGCQTTENEESRGSKVLENNKSQQTGNPGSLESRAMAWDEAERAKYMARYKQKEVKIQAWESHEKKKAELEMRKMEVKAERLKSRAQEKLANKLAATRRIAEEKRANAEAKLNEQAVRTSERAEYIRRTGHMPSSFSFKVPSRCW